MSLEVKASSHVELREKHCFGLLMEEYVLESPFSLRERREGVAFGELQRSTGKVSETASLLKRMSSEAEQCF